MSDLPPDTLSGLAGPLMAVLIPRGGTAPGERHTLRRAAVTLGRGEDNDVVVADPSVSEHHAALRLAGGVWLLHDLDTVNGSWVDGQPVHGQLPLASGSTIRFGAAEFVFSPHDRWEDSPAAPMRGTADEPGPGFAFGIPDRQGFPTSLWAGLIIVALAIVGVLLLRAG